MTDGSLSTTTETPVEAKDETERDGSQTEPADGVPLTPQTTKAPAPTTETTSITETAEPMNVTVEDKTANWVLLAHPEEDPVVITTQDPQGVTDQRPLTTSSDAAHLLNTTAGGGPREDEGLSLGEGTTFVQPLVTEEPMSVTSQIADRPSTLPPLSAAETSAESLPPTVQDSALSRYCQALSAGASSLAESGWRGTCKYTPVAAGGLLLGTSYLFQGVEFVSSAIQLRAREKGRQWLGMKESEISVNPNQS